MQELQKVQEIVQQLNIIDDGTDIAELMHIFTDINVYDFEKFPKVSKRKKQFKTNEGGKNEVCDLVENYARERAKKEAADSAKKFFENGVSYEVVRASITLLSDEELQKIYKKVNNIK
ncbi:MAG: hypothetical protein IJ439_01300 [Tyzzerella sp.]|nr:hypothetical protein [Tyzzerella sp.]